MNKEGDQFVFVGGCPRSGTSLLQKMLDLHSEVYAGPEFDHLPSIMRTFKGMLNGIENKRQASYYDEITVRKAISDLLVGILDGVRTKNNAALLSEKTPSNVLVFEELRELFPKAKFIFVVRDPRGIYNSFRMVGQRAKKQKAEKVNYGVNLKSDLDRIHKHLKAGTEFVGKYPEKSLVVEYEELVNDPKMVIGRVCDFLNISYEQTMLDTHKQNESSRLIRDGGEHVSPFYTKEIYDRKVDANSSMKWKSDLSWMKKNAVAYFFQSNDIETLRRYNLTNKSFVARIYLAVSRGFSIIRYILFK